MKPTTKAPAKKKVAARKKAPAATPSRRRRSRPEFVLDLSQLTAEEAEFMNAVAVGCARSILAQHDARNQETK